MLRDELNRKAGEEEKFRNLVNDYQKLQREIGEWERKHDLTIRDYEIKINQRITEYESRI